MDRDNVETLSFARLARNPFCEEIHTLHSQWRKYRATRSHGSRGSGTAVTSDRGQSSLAMAQRGGASQVPAGVLKGTRRKKERRHGQDETSLRSDEVYLSQL